MVQWEDLKTEVGHIISDNTVEVMISSKQRRDKVAAYTEGILRVKKEVNAINTGHKNCEWAAF